MPTQKRAYDGSLKAVHSTSGPALRGGKRACAIVTATIELKSITNPMVRTVHPKPIFGSNC